jgi:hypothetical protein
LAIGRLQSCGRARLLPSRFPHSKRDFAFPSARQEPRPPSKSDFADLLGLGDRRRDDTTAMESERNRSHPRAFRLSNSRRRNSALHPSEFARRRLRTPYIRQALTGVKKTSLATSYVTSSRCRVDMTRTVQESVELHNNSRGKKRPNPLQSSTLHSRIKIDCWPSHPLRP